MSDDAAARTARRRWLLCLVVMLAVILVPFWLFGRHVDTFAKDLLAGSRNPWFVGVVGTMLLASDPLLPVPSSLVSTGLGAFLGVGWGLVASWIGMTLGGVWGYWLGVSLAAPAVRRVVESRECARLAKAMERHGAAILIACRAVPVLAEASMIAAGAAGMSRRRAYLAMAVGNLVMSAVYVVVGAQASSAISFLWAFGLSMGVSAVAWLVGHRWMHSVF